MNAERLFSETCRYLGLKKAPAAPEEALIRRALARLSECAAPRSLTARFPLESSGPEGLSLAGVRIPGSSLPRHLAGCTEILLFAATLGEGPDLLMRRASLTDMPLAAALQAASAAYLEEVCNDEEDALRREYAADGLFLRPRYSPGYGDLPLTFQKDLFRLLRPEKHLGLTLTETCQMIPTKSVTALIGVSAAAGPDDNSCAPAGCAACTHRNCEFRRE